jgi:hypothetical protein
VVVLVEAELVLEAVRVVIVQTQDLLLLLELLTQ